MPDISHDLNYVAAGLSELKTYLLSKELFWPLRLKPTPGKPSSAKLTPGNLLLSFTRLGALHHSKKMSTKQESELLKLKRDFDVLKTKWAVAWEKKVTQEFTSRLRQWRLYLNELARDAMPTPPTMRPKCACEYSWSYSETALRKSPKRIYLPWMTNYAHTSRLEISSGMLIWPQAFRRRSIGFYAVILDNVLKIFKFRISYKHSPYYTTKKNFFNLSSRYI